VIAVSVCEQGQSLLKASVPLAEASGFLDLAAKSTGGLLS